LYARIITFRVRDGNLDQVLSIIKEVVIPAAYRQEGFSAYILMSDREGDKVTTTSLWETEADMFFSEESEYFQEQISRVVALLAGPPQIERYRVEALS
jgi:quinol monooxygenase YgiN